MQNPAPLFDPDARAQRRARAADDQSDIWFLHRQAAEVVQERLQEVNRTFNAPAIIGWKAELWAHLLNLPATTYPDNDDLALPKSAHDLIIHALCLHSHNDPIGQLIQLRRALKPDGLMIAVLFGGQTLAQLRSAFATAEASVLGGITPRVSPMGEIRDLGALIQRAGLALPVADNFCFDVRYATGLDLMKELRQMGEGNCLTARSKYTLRRDVLATALSEYQSNFSDDDGRLRASFDLIFLTGWAPSETQPKPLRPGSAKTSLATALGVPEQNPKKD